MAFRRYSRYRGSYGYRKRWTSRWNTTPRVFTPKTIKRLAVEATLRKAETKNLIMVPGLDTLTSQSTAWQTKILSKPIVPDIAQSIKDGDRIGVEVSNLRTRFKLRFELNLAVMTANDQVNLRFIAYLPKLRDNLTGADQYLTDTFSGQLGRNISHMLDQDSINVLKDSGVITLGVAVNKTWVEFNFFYFAAQWNLIRDDVQTTKDRHPKCLLVFSSNKTSAEIGSLIQSRQVTYKDA